MHFNRESGIAIGPILFIIAILAVLAAAIAAGSGSFTGNTNTLSDKVIAATILDYLNTLDRAVQKVEMNGYDQHSISFETPAGELNWGGDAVDYSYSYVNGNCASDTCKIFMPSGGGAVAIALPIGSIDPAILATLSPQCSDSNNYLPCRNPFGIDPSILFPAFPAALALVEIRGVGAAGYFRYGVILNGVPSGVCNEINKQVGVGTASGVVTNNNDQGTTSNVGAGYTGTLGYFVFGSLFDSNTSPSIKGKKTFCWTGSNYMFGSGAGFSAGQLVHQL